MAFRASNQIQADTYSRAKSTAAAIKQRVDGIIPRFQAGNGDSVDVIDRVATTLRVSMDEFARIRAIPGIAQYARDQEDDPTYDVIAEFTAMENGILDVIAWVAANFPTDSGGFMLERTMSVDGTFVNRVFTSVQVAPLVTRLQALSALIS